MENSTDEVEEDIDDAMASLPKYISDHLSLLSNVSQRQASNLYDAVDPDNSFTKQHVKSKMERQKFLSEGWHRDPEVHIQAATNAGIEYLVHGFDIRVGSARKIQAAFRKFKSQCLISGWPSQSRQKAVKGPRARYLQGVFKSAMTNPRPAASHSSAAASSPPQQPFPPAINRPSSGNSSSSRSGQAAHLLQSAASLIDPKLISNHGAFNQQGSSHESKVPAHRRFSSFKRSAPAGAQNKEVSPQEGPTLHADSGAPEGTKQDQQQQQPVADVQEGKQDQQHQHQHQHQPVADVLLDSNDMSTTTSSETGSIMTMPSSSVQQQLGAAALLLVPSLPGPLQIIQEVDADEDGYSPAAVAVAEQTHLSSDTSNKGAARSAPAPAPALKLESSLRHLLVSSAVAFQPSGPLEASQQSVLPLPSSPHYNQHLFVEALRPHHSSNPDHQAPAPGTASFLEPPLPNMSAAVSSMLLPTACGELQGTSASTSVLLADAGSHCDSSPQETSVLLADAGSLCDSPQERQGADYTEMSLAPLPILQLQQHLLEATALPAAPAAPPRPSTSLEDEEPVQKMIDGSSASSTHLLTAVQETGHLLSAVLPENTDPTADDALRPLFSSSFHPDETLLRNSGSGGACPLPSDYCHCTPVIVVSDNDTAANVAVGGNPSSTSSDRSIYSGSSVKAGHADEIMNPAVVTMTAVARTAESPHMTAAAAAASRTTESPHMTAAAASAAAAAAARTTEFPHMTAAAAAARTTESPHMMTVLDDAPGTHEVISMSVSSVPPEATVLTAATAAAAAVHTSFAEAGIPTALYAVPGPLASEEALRMVTEDISQLVRITDVKANIPLLAVVDDVGDRCHNNAAKMYLGSTDEGSSAAAAASPAPPAVVVGPHVSNGIAGNEPDSYEHYHNSTADVYNGHRFLQTATILHAAAAAAAAVRPATSDEDDNEDPGPASIVIPRSIRSLRRSSSSSGSSYYTPVPTSPPLQLSPSQSAQCLVYQDPYDESSAPASSPSVARETAVQVKKQQPQHAIVDVVPAGGAEELHGDVVPAGGAEELHGDVVPAGGDEELHGDVVPAGGAEELYGDVVPAGGEEELHGDVVPVVPAGGDEELHGDVVPAGGGDEELHGDVEGFSSNCSDDEDGCPPATTAAVTTTVAHLAPGQLHPTSPPVLPHGPHHTASNIIGRGLDDAVSSNVVPSWPSSSRRYSRAALSVSEHAERSSTSSSHIMADVGSTMMAPHQLSDEDWLPQDNDDSSRHSSSRLHAAAGGLICTSASSYAMPAGSRSFDVKQEDAVRTKPTGSTDGEDTMMFSSQLLVHHLDDPASSTAISTNEMVVKMSPVAMETTVPQSLFLLAGNSQLGPATINGASAFITQSRPHVTSRAFSSPLFKHSRYAGSSSPGRGDADYHGSSSVYLHHALKSNASAWHEGISQASTRSQQPAAGVWFDDGRPTHSGYSPNITPSSSPPLSPTMQYNCSSILSASTAETAAGLLYMNSRPQPKKMALLSHSVDGGYILAGSTDASPMLPLQQQQQQRGRRTSNNKSSAVTSESAGAVLAGLPEGMLALRQMVSAQISSQRGASAGHSSTLINAGGFSPSRAYRALSVGGSSIPSAHSHTADTPLLTVLPSEVRHIDPQRSHLLHSTQRAQSGAIISPSRTSADNDVVLLYINGRRVEASKPRKLLYQPGENADKMQSGAAAAAGRQQAAKKVHLASGRRSSSASLLPFRRGHSSGLITHAFAGSTTTRLEARHSATISARSGMSAISMMKGKSSNPLAVPAAASDLLDRRYSIGVAVVASVSAGHQDIYTSERRPATLSPALDGWLVSDNADALVSHEADIKQEHQQYDSRTYLTEGAAAAAPYVKALAPPSEDLKSQFNSRKGVSSKAALKPSYNNATAVSLRLSWGTAWEEQVRAQLLGENRQGVMNQQAGSVMNQAGSVMVSGGVFGVPARSSLPSGQKYSMTPAV
ncbi:hypothetical protein CEUSTIGMA_g4417.t1 [Chlamydomonas eustigma]|uniref:Uncharacterized protein n=1 Tax=Chlamydomonas eustigma TaxID=1157962 RepID=A0A250X2J1_9CHLO|nr:hypothetical protein CEUSTIGMA_g4417.t1 [Chlamydomonas eustigma]|eukprot:GAX76970.1 hypothetical protein CEUSTIGMA_g4417.t1 [Chlamydomonas eustigma]